MEGVTSIEEKDRHADPARWTERYGERLHRYAFRRIRDWHEAQDVVQETWLAALQGQARFSGRSSEQAWLVGILKHKVIDSIRIAFREPPLSDAQSLQIHETGRLNDRTWPASRQASEVDPFRQLERKQLKALLDRCLCQLSARMKAVFASCDIEEMPHRDAARLLGVTESHLYVLLHRARQRVRQCLTVHYVDGSPRIAGERKRSRGSARSSSE